MGIRPNNTERISVQLTKEEKDMLDEAAKAANLNRNRFIRNWIATLVRRP